MIVKKGDFEEETVTDTDAESVLQAVCVFGVLIDGKKEAPAVAESTDVCDRLKNGLADAELEMEGDTVLEASVDRECTDVRVAVAHAEAEEKVDTELDELSLALTVVLAVRTTDLLLEPVDDGGTDAVTCVDVETDSLGDTVLVRVVLGEAEIEGDTVLDTESRADGVCVFDTVVVDIAVCDLDEVALTVKEVLSV